VAVQERCAVFSTHLVTDLPQACNGNIGSLLIAARDADGVDAAKRLHNGSKTFVSEQFAAWVFEEDM